MFIGLACYFVLNAEENRHFYLKVAENIEHFFLNISAIFCSNHLFFNLSMICLVNGTMLVFKASITGSAGRPEIQTNYFSILLKPRTLT